MSPTELRFADVEIHIQTRRAAPDGGAEVYPLEITLEHSQVFQGEVPAATLAAPANGAVLLDALLANEALKGAWTQARGIAADRRRLRLRIDAPELAALPWETLSEQHVLLAANAATPFSRYLPTAENAWGGVVESRPLRVLVVLSNPADLGDVYNLAALDVAAERALLESALTAGMFALDFLEPPATLERIEERLRSGYPIVHYVGHGVFNKRKSQAALYLQDAAGDTQIVRDDQVVEMLKRLLNRPRLMFLAACQSAMRSTGDAFAGLGPKLVEAGAPAVVAMQDTISVESARQISRVFYAQLAQHGEVDLALNEARATLCTAGQSDVAAPVLFMRLTSGLLWEPEAETPSTPVASGPTILPPPDPTPIPKIDSLVPREKEIAYFEEKLRTGRFALISGMPGMGKSSLAAMLAHRFGDPQRVFWHTFHKDEGVESLIWKLAGYLYWRGQRTLWEMLQAAQQNGGRLLPNVMLFDYIYQMLRDSATLLCLDEFQYVDANPDLEQLCRRLIENDAQTALIISSHRVPTFIPPDAFEPLAGLSLKDALRLFEQLGFPVKVEDAERVRIYRTTQIRRTDLLRTPDVVATLTMRTGGNIYLLSMAAEILKNTPENKVAGVLLGLFGRDNIEQFLVREIDEHLTPDERAVMCAIAILIGRPGTRYALEAVLRDDPRLQDKSVRETLRSLRARHLVRVSAGEADREYNLDPVVREFYYDMLTRAQRDEWHQRAAVYYEVEENDELRAARHFVRITKYEKAAQLLVNNTLRLLNLGQAQAFEEQLASFTPQQVSAEVWVRIHLARGQIHTLQTHNAAAQVHYTEALAGLPAVLEDARRVQSEVEVRRWWAEWLYQSSEYDAAAEQIRRAQALLPPAEDHATAPLAAELLLLAAHVHIRRGEYHEAEAKALAGLEAGRKLLLPLAVARAYNLLGRIYDARGNHTAAIEYLQNAVHAYDALSNLDGVAKSHNLLGNVYFNQGQWPAAQDQYHYAGAIFKQLGNVRMSAVVSNNLGIIAIHQGRADEALTLIQEALAALDSAGTYRYEQSALHSTLGDIYLRRNDLVAARQHLQISLDYVTQLHVRDYLPELYCLCAEVEWRSGMRDVAQAYTQQSLDLARELGMRRDEGRALGLLGELALACATDEAQIAAAVAQLDAAMTLLQSVAGATLLLARVQYTLARAYMAQGATDAARSLSAAALQAFESAQATPEKEATLALQNTLECR